MHSHPHQHTPDTHKHTMPKANNCNINCKDVLQSYNNRRDHTSSAQLGIIRNKRSPNTGKNHSRKLRGPLPPEQKTRASPTSARQDSTRKLHYLASTDRNVHPPQPDGQSSAATIRSRPAADAHAKLDSPNETVQGDGRRPRHTNAAPSTRRH